MLQKLKNQISSRKTLASKMYIIVLIIGTFTNFASFVITCAEQLDKAAIISTFLCFATLGFFWYLSIAKDMEQQLHLPLMIITIFGLLPLAWFYCGGIRSGMIMYFLGCLFLIVPCIMEVRKRVILFIVSLLWLMGIIVFSVFFRPDLVIQLSDREWYLDVLVTLPLCATGIFIITTLVVNAYETERRDKEKLLNEMEMLAKVDPLTGLYNRREMFARFEEGKHYYDGHHYLIMMDIDFFKKINDSYGHMFGDKAIQYVASVLKENACEENDGFAARYGGEEFVAVIRCEDDADALQRAETIRLRIYVHQYEEYPDLHISVSGGIVVINNDTDIAAALSAADKLLYKAKEGGRNRMLNIKTGG
ncbi:MAG: GGDEF domain-containing protein [Lachnospiraceae bacterium]|nr:GGDEF domain-containing protein [Lachnospiraceae bacterium]